MEAATARERVYDVFAGTGGDPETQAARALDVGTEYLDLGIGFLTRIEGGVQEIVVSTGDHELLRPGATCPLEDTYCRRTVEIDDVLAVQDAPDSPAIAERAVRTFGLDAYVGAKVVAAGEVYGTVCFADTATRTAGFSEIEEVFVELVATLIGQAFERREFERELRQRNDRLQREKRRFRGIAETSFDVLFRVGPDAEFTYVSAAVDRVLGQSAEELVGSQFTEFLAESSVEDALRAYAEVLEGTAVEQVELEFLDADGERVVLEVNAAPFEAADATGVQGVGRDVTARRERERELRIKDRAIDDTRAGIVIADATRPDNPLVYVNEGFTRATGYAADEVLGENCRFLQGEATDAESVDLLRERIAAGEPATVELVNYRKDGTPFWNQVQVSPVENDAGELTHYLGFQNDVTDRKRTEQLIRLLNRVLRHNLRNDVNVILGFADAIQGASGDDAERFGGYIRDTAETLIDLSERARDLQRFAGRQRDPRRLDPGSVLKSVADAHRDRFPAATVDLRIGTDRGLCAGPEVERAVSELVENALKHNPAPAPWVGIEVIDDGAWLELTVADDGPGIGETEVAPIASGRETTLDHGSGLGLWLVNWVVTRYGGSFQLRAEGEDGGGDGDGGTVATVRLPGIDPDAPVEEAARPSTVLFR